MILFKTLKYKNFLSTGNKFIRHDFVSGKKKLIVGKNGSGKSIIIDALCFVLYNKAFRKCKKDQLVNSINKKNMIVELEFSIGNKEYKIRRGVRPVFTELYVDGALKDQDASSYDYQSYIENSVLRMTEKTFRQIVVLGSTAFVPFMRLSAHIRRVVIEDLLEVAIYTNMYDVIKQKSNSMQVELQNLLNRMKIIQNSITHKTEALDSADNSNNNLITENKESIETLETEYGDFNQELSDIMTRTKTHLDTIDDTNELLEKLDDEKFELLDLVSKISLNKTKNEKEIKFFNENEHCPVCHQDIESEFKAEKIVNNEKRAGEFESGLANIAKLIEDKSGLIIDNNTKIKTLKAELLEIVTVSDKMKVNQDDQQKLIKINKTLTKSNTSEIAELKSTLAEYESQLEEAEIDKSKFMETVNAFTYIKKLLNDDGVKSKVIKTYLPIINKLIRKYLDIMDFSVDFRFDEFFNETIKARYKDNFSYGNFSEGQKLRIDLCLLFTWRELSRLKNSAATNLIILDEIGDSSLDIEGFDAFINVLNVDKESQCAIIISHKPDGISASVDEIVTASMVGNFTEMVSTFPESIPT